MRLRVVAVFAVLVVGIVVLGGGTCKRACETADNCKRTCQCTNAVTDAAFPCTIAFRCNGADQVCEDDFDTLSCTDVCKQYHDNCGTERCNDDKECTKSLSCPLRDAQGNPTASLYDCTLCFTCDQTQSICAPASTASNDQLCLQCDAERAGQVAPSCPQ